MWQDFATYFSVGVGVGIALRLVCVLLGGTMQYVKSLINAM
tara:strand:+ start:139 stop:261 length:123 start_codon:yes stop_codon:yes gene_type:complete